jgi:hypothetical protein
MNPDTIQVVMERIEALERERRQLFWGSGVVVCVALAVTAAHARLLTGGGTISAQKIVLKDWQGITRATLMTHSDGSPSLSFLDNKGDAKLRLQAADNNSAALTFLQNERVQMALSWADGGAASLQMADRHARGSMGLFLSPDGSANLGFRTHDQSIELATNADGRSGLTITGDRGAHRQYVGAVGQDRQPPTAVVPSRAPDDSAYAPKPRAASPILAQ